MTRSVPQPESSTPLPTQVANARVHLALLRMFEKVPLAENIEHNYGSIAEVFWPLMRRYPAALRSSLSKWVSRRDSMKPERKRSQVSRIELLTASSMPHWLPDFLSSKGALTDELPDSELLSILGAGLVRNMAAFAPFFSLLRGELEARVMSERLATDWNIDWLASLLSLDTTSQRVLSLAAALEIGTVERDILAHIQRPARRDQALRVALGLESDQAAARATRRRSPLLRTGLLERRCSDLADVLTLTTIGSVLVTSHFKSVDEMAERVLRPLKPSTSAIALRWPHLQQRTDLLQDLLVSALASKARGINLLLYGSPGTGKTEYAKQLVKAVQAMGFEIDDKADDESPASREQRLAHLRLSELFAPAGRSILLLDEAEDVFQVDYNSPLRGAMGEETDSKAWMNRVLEDNASPVIWISNKIDQIDPAYLRRFTYCLEFPVMPLTVRRDIARAHLEPAGCSDHFIEAISAHPNLTPALFSSAARFVGLSRARGTPTVSKEPADAAARHVLMGHLHAMGDKPIATVPSSMTRFDMRYLHVQGRVQPPEVVSALQRTGKGTLLLGGPPGTGKTQLAAEIARRLGRELVYRTASDINSMWFGESERNVAKLFTECDGSAEVLFIDEADTLLGDRAGGAHRVDRAVTAEFLRRVEAFEGVFVCATNHASDFEPALMRRFSFRLGFLPLNQLQRAQLLEDCMRQAMPPPSNAGPALDDEQLSRLQRLDQLTPGDFANVARRLDSLQIAPDARGWIDELQAEHDAKPGGSRRAMGFV